MKFKVGDRVSYMGDTFKDTGTVVKIEADKTHYIVRMDHYPGWRIYSDEHLHTEDGLEVGTGYWFCNDAELEPYADPAEKKEVFAEDKADQNNGIKVGDRVVVKECATYPPLAGTEGRVVGFKCGGELTGIEFEQSNPEIFHDCCGKGRPDHCLWVNSDHVAKVPKDTPKKLKHQVGERAVFAKPVWDNEGCYAGKIGTIAVVHDNGLGGVLEFDDGGKVCFIWSELDPAPESKPEEPKKSAGPDWINDDPEKKVEKEIPRTIVIRVSSKGATAKYLFGKKVQAEAEIRKHPDDQPNDALAATLVIEKMFGKHNCGSIDEMNAKAECASKAADALRKIDWNALMFEALADK